MKAIQISEYGNPDVLQLTDRDIPAPAGNEVLIKVHAAGINRPDVLQRLGKYPPPEGITDIPGLEVAGEVVESQSSHWKAGDRVCALLAGGGYAEYAVAPAGQCLPIPDGLSFEDAAALPEVVFTVWNNLILRGALKGGESVLIHGGSSGIGTMAIQIAKVFGAEMIVTTAGTDDKCEACEKLGANLAINYKAHDFEEETLRITNGKGVDLVLDMVGGDYVPKNLKLLKTDGRHVSIAFLSGVTTEINIKQIMAKRLTLTGSTLRARPVAEKAELAKQIHKNVWPKIEQGLVKAVIHKVFSMEQVADAHKLMEGSNHIGKLVLKII